MKKIEQTFNRPDKDRKMLGIWNEVVGSVFMIMGVECGGGGKQLMDVERLCRI